MARDVMINNLRNPPTRRLITNLRKSSIRMATLPRRKNKGRKEPVLLVVGRDIWQRIAQARRTKERRKSRRKLDPI